MYRKMNLDEFVSVTASQEPTPGGGAIAALCGAMGAALAQMVANLTLGKSNYEAVQADMEIIGNKAKNIQNQLLFLIEEDAKAFNSFMESMKLPKDTDKQTSERQLAMQNALKLAADVPFKIAQISFQIMDLAEIGLEKGNKNVATDAVIAAVMSRSAVLSAILNVRINLKYIRDDRFVENFEKECIKLETEVKNREKNILDNLTL